MAKVARLEQIPEHERLNPEKVVETISASGKPAFYEPSVNDIIHRLKPLAKPGDVVVIFSNGGFDVIFPCLNPWGIVNNRRLNESGHDLNRHFHRKDEPVINAVKAIIKPHRFAISLMLHEDYDGQGVYFYETQRATPFWAEALLKAAKPFIPGDTRARIDGRKCTKPGIVRRKISMKVFERIGFPEAIHMHLYHSERTFTVETPSEYGLDRRVSAHIAIIEECVKRVLPRATRGGASRA
jgi:hypothetical protein